MLAPTVGQTTRTMKRGVTLFTVAIVVAVGCLMAGSLVVAATGFPPCLKSQNQCLPPMDGTTDVFCPGHAQYCCYKIPSLLRVPPFGRLANGRLAPPQGLLLAFVRGLMRNAANTSAPDSPNKQNALGRLKLASTAAMTMDSLICGCVALWMVGCTGQTRRWWQVVSPQVATL